MCQSGASGSDTPPATIFTTTSSAEHQEHLHDKLQLCGTWTQTFGCQSRKQQTEKREVKDKLMKMRSDLNQEVQTQSLVFSAEEFMIQKHQVLMEQQKQKHQKTLFLTYFGLLRLP